MPEERAAREVEREVRLRRWKRHLKAAAAVLLAAAAGLFLTAAKAAKPSHSKDAGVGDAGAGDGGVDRDEHRKGMPVRDNLLE